MGRPGPLLLALLASLGTSLGGRGGDPCRRWAAGAEPPAGAFPCAARSDGADAAAAFCCGPCRAPYCCSSAEARLDPHRCPGGDAPSARSDPLYSFYIPLGLTAAAALGCFAYVFYRQICLSLWGCIRARRRVHGQDTTPSRVSFQDPSPTFVYNAASRLRGPNPPPLYHAYRAVRLSGLPPDNRDSPAQPSQANSGTPGDDAASSSSAEAPQATSPFGGTPQPEEYPTSPKQMGSMVPVPMG